MNQLPNAEYKVNEQISWFAKVNLAWNSDISKTYGVFNKQLAALPNCAIKMIVVNKERGITVGGHEHEIKIFLDKNFVDTSDRLTLVENLHAFLQEYLNLNKMALGSFKTDFVQSIKSIDKFMMEKPSEENNETTNLSDVLQKRRAML